MSRSSLPLLLLGALLTLLPPLLAAGEGGGHGGGATEEPEFPPKGPYYVSLGKPILVTVLSEGKVQYLQVLTSIKAVNVPAAAKVKENLVPIRHELNMLFCDRNYHDLMSAERRPRLREEATEAVRRVLLKNSGIPGVETVYFTSFFIK